MIIYRAINLVNGKSYIGKTTHTLLHRQTQHIKASTKHTGNIFHRALRKYGTSTWDWVVLDNAECGDVLNQLEIHYIDVFRSYIGFDDCVGYNMTLGGEGGYINEHHPDKNAIYKKISNSNKGANHFLNKMSDIDREAYLDSHLRGKHNPSYGRPRTDLQLEAVRKTGLSQRGKKHTDETRSRMSIGGKGKLTGEKNPNFGKTGASFHGAKTIVVIFPDGKEVVTHCISEFATVYNLQPQNLSMVAKGKYKQHKGFKAREYNEATDYTIEVWIKETE